MEKEKFLNQEQNLEINNLEDAQNEVIKRDINPDVYNALNLYNKKLGEEYEKEGYNPFSPEFKLTKEFAEEVLEKKREKMPVNHEKFLDYGPKKTTDCFKNTLLAGEKLAEKLEQAMSSQSIDASTLHQMQQALIFLKNRNQLLKRNIKELKFKSANSLEMFIDMYELDKILSKLLKETYEKNADLDKILVNFIEVCKTRAKIKQDLKNKEKLKAERRKELEEEIAFSLESAGSQMIEDIEELSQIGQELIEDIQYGISGITESISEHISDAVENVKDAVEDIKDDFSEHTL